MHRQRKKDLNLKPNRTLDKRSSRGMIYENEELRLRTITINEEIDRGHNDIKKLKKENDTLKREVWNLRDEYEKLEDMFKQVCTMTKTEVPQEFEPFAGYNPNRRVSTGGETVMTSNYDSEDEEHAMLMIDDDGTGSLLGMKFGGSGEIQAGTSPDSPGFMEPNLSLFPDTDGGQMSDGGVDHVAGHSGKPTFHGHPGRGHGHPTIAAIPELEIVREESEVASSSNLSIITSPVPPLELPTVMEGDLIMLQCPDPVPPTPTIEITPASSPMSNMIDGIRKIPVDEDESEMDSGDFQDIGCVAVIPKSFQVTSEIQIEDKVTSGDSSADPSRTNSPTLLHPTGSPMIKHKLPFYKNRFNGKGGKGKPRPLTQCATPTIYLLTNDTSGANLATCCPDSFCRSEPSLTSVCHNLEFGSFNGFDPTVGLFVHDRHKVSSHGWNSVDKNVVVAAFDPSFEILRDVRAQEVIDALETQFDATLERISGVRMIPGRIFVSLRHAAAVKLILEKHNTIIIRNQTLKFTDASKKFTTVVLSGLPPDLSDMPVISGLNQFGQVVAPLERRIYKGVDISERICHMHLVKQLPPLLSIAGYEVRTAIVRWTSNSSNSDMGNASRSQPGSNTELNACTSLSVCPSGGDVSSATPSALALPQPNVTGQPAVGQSMNNANLNNLPVNPHKPLSRSSSSHPRLESHGQPGFVNPAILSAIEKKRQMSVCTQEPFLPEDHPSRRASINNNNNNINNNNNLPPNPKKPLSRLLKSSPASLQPAGTNVTQPATEPGAFKSFCRSLSSFDNRRSSNASSQFGVELPPAAPQGMPVPYKQGITNRGFQPMLPSAKPNLNMSPMKVEGRGKSNKPLPWCGCWGNGCI